MDVLYFMDYLWKGKNHFVAIFAIINDLTNILYYFIIIPLLGIDPKEYMKALI